MRAAELVDARVRRPPLGAVARVPLHDREPRRARSVPRPLRVVGARAARPGSAAARRRSVPRRARLRELLPQGPGGCDDQSARASTRPGATTATACSRYEIRATAFCWQMVRSIVGTLADVGVGRITPGDVLGILRAAIARPQVASRRRTGCACATSGTDRARSRSRVDFGTAARTHMTVTRAEWVRLTRGTTAAPDTKRLDRIRDMYADELAGGALYRGLAEYADDDRRSVFLQLADAEERHAEHWARLLREARRRAAAAARLPVPRARARASWRVTSAPRRCSRSCCAPRRPRPTATATTPKPPATMAKQEAAAGRTIAAMQGIPAGGRIARSEGRHRAGVGRRAARHRVRRERRAGVELLAGDGRRRRHQRQRASCCSPASPGSSPARSRWRRASGSRCARSASCTRTSCASSARSCSAFPEEERDELELIYRAKGIAPAAAHSLADSIMDRSDVALDTLAREELGLDPTQARVAVGRGDLVVPRLRVRRVAAAHPVPLRQRHRAPRSSSAVISVLALFAVGAATSIFTGRHAGRAGLRMAVIGAVVATVTFFVGNAVGASV